MIFNLKKSKKTKLKDLEKRVAILEYQVHNHAENFKTIIK